MSMSHDKTFFDNLLESIPDIMFAKDTMGVYRGCNSKFSEFVGHSVEQIVGRTDSELFGQDIADSFQKYDQLMFASGTPQRNDEWISYPDGRRALVETYKAPLRDQAGTLIGLLGISRDITERWQAETDVRQMRENFDTFFNCIHDFLFVLDESGAILHVNRTVTKRLGYIEPELHGRSVLDVHPADRRDEAGAIVQSMLLGEVDHCPVPLITKDGALIAVETRVTRGIWNGMPVLFGVSKDVSDLRRSEEKFSLAFQNSAALMAISSLEEGRFSDVNRAFIETTGYSREEVIGRTAQELGLFVDTKDRETARQSMDQSGRVCNLECQIRTKSGAIRDGIFSANAIQLGSLHCWLSVMTDITDRKRAEIKLNRLFDVQRQLMHLATHFVNVSSDQQEAAIRKSLEMMGQLIHADRAYLFGYDFDRNVMSNTFEWCAAGVSPEIDNLQDVPLGLFPDWVQSHQRGDMVHISDVGGLPNSSPLRQILLAQGIQTLITLPLMHEGKCLGFVGFDAVREARGWLDEEVSFLRVLAELYANLETRRKSEQEINRLNVKLTSLLQISELAKEEAQAAARSKSMFLANMSHEIRTPLNAILGYSQIMQHECRKCQVNQRGLGAISKNGEHLLELLTNILDLAHSEAKQLVPDPSRFDFYQLLEDVRLMFALRAESSGLMLEVFRAPSVPQFIFADNGKIRQILLNLVGNAMKFTEKGFIRMRVDVVCSETPGSLMVAVDVEDTGCGIPQNDHERIFEIFEQVGIGPNASRGTGLGLPLSRRYARVLGGDITICDAAGPGSRFQFTFAAQISDGMQGGVERPRKLVSRLTPGQMPVRLLVVDDEPSNCEMLDDLLTRCGFIVDVASSGKQALLKISQTERYSLVLLDSRMPIMNGLETMRRMRELPEGRDLPVLFVTANGDAAWKQSVILAGAAGCIYKPIQRQRILDEIGWIDGVQYDYEQDLPVCSDKLSADASDTDSFVHMMESLTVAQRDSLDQVLRCGDVRGLRETVQAISSDHAALAERLSRLVEAYDYDGLRYVLDSVNKTMPGGGKGSAS